MEALLDLQHALAFIWLMSAEGRTISKIMDSIHGSAIMESNFLS